MSSADQASRDEASNVGAAASAGGDRPVRYRCTGCGNLTRFDVTTSRRTRAFHHYTVGGDLQLEDVEVLSEVVEDVRCRWCGTGSSVVELRDGDDVPSADG